MKLDKKDLLLYAVTDSYWAKTKNTSFYEQIKASLQGGVTMLQLREKNLNYEDFESEAREIQELCSEFEVPFLINDNVQLAKKIDADGVHIGQDDMKLEEARKILGKDKIIGVSVQNLDQALKAENEGADYLGVGSVFPTQSKDDALMVSLETLKEISSSVKIPIVAIGGITEENMIELKDSGINGIALISAIYSKENIKEATERLLKKAGEYFYD
ncbi:MAG: thiamine phosphate synthase [Treponemataceae bacterium]|nr:thiamine phosphate synthase [Treponemataceae bacterium]